MNNVNNNNNTTNSSYKERIEQARKQAEKQYNKFKVLLSMMGGGAVLSFALFMTMVRFFDVSHFFPLTAFDFFCYNVRCRRLVGISSLAVQSVQRRRKVPRPS